MSADSTRVASRGPAELPSIGIAVPSFNQARYLGEALESIFRQQYPRLEVVVMDGGSTDGSVDIIRSYADRLAYWRSAPDGGQSAAINEGMGRLQTDVIAWLNSDDYYWGDCLWTIARAASEHPGAGLFIGNGLRHLEREDTYRLFCPRHVALNRRALREGPDYLLQPCVFFLRRAWRAVGGLDETLHYCMDWDVFLRIAETFPAVAINEIVAVSREHEATKTSRGAIARCEEIARMTRARSGLEVTAGSLNYLLETLIDLSAASLPSVHPHLRRAMLELGGDFGRVCGVVDGWPEQPDPQDHVLVPLAAGAKWRRMPGPDEGVLPSISVIVPLAGESSLLDAALDSILGQGYPRAEAVVVDARAQPTPLAALEHRAGRLTLVRSDAANGIAHAIQLGLDRASGTVVGWLEPGDRLADGALHHVGEAFAESSDLDVLYANAVYVDDRNRLALADHDVHRTAFHYGRLPAMESYPAYWKHDLRVAPSTVFFHARLVGQRACLDPSYRHAYGFELFWRLAGSATVQKLERTQALLRVRDDRDVDSLAELYRASRARWPPAGSGALRTVARDFVAHYMQRRFAAAPRDTRFWVTASLVGLSALTGFGNPESWQIGERLDAPRPSSVQLTAPLPVGHLITAGRCRRASKRAYRSLFCAPTLPPEPGRDRQLLQRLASLGRVEAFALDCADAAGAPFDGVVHTPEKIRRQHPEWFDSTALDGGSRESLATRAGMAARRRGLPVIGPRYQLEVTERILPMIAGLWRALQEALSRDRPDFLFISPERNPIALYLRVTGLHTRLILVAHDGDDGPALRPNGDGAAARLADVLELARARRFAGRNLALYDGIIVASAARKTAFVEDSGFDARRVLVIEDGADAGAWEENLGAVEPWLELLRELPRRTARGRQRRPIRRTAARG